MRLLAGDRDVVPALPQGALHRADGNAPILQDGALLDVRLEVGADASGTGGLRTGIADGIQRLAYANAVAVPGSRALLLAFCCYLANYLVLGTGIAAMSSLLLGDAAPPPLLLTGAFAVSWIIGFFMPGAPAGLGVREGAILTLLQASGAGADMLLLVIGLRVATTAGDLICFTVASAFRFAARKGRSLPHT